MKNLLLRLFIALRNAVIETVDIGNTTDRENTIKNIHENIYVKGYNIWILACSALLASIGLDTNSSAIIIGAMLISPLMSPILGVGLGLAINDRPMFVHALQNLGVATVIALFFSGLYFILTPIGEPTTEILARTKPTLLDVLVAFFGGIAGIISSSRTEKTNAIPGVAIATALMPPLCTAGYGLSKADLPIFLGGFYLFVLNAVFISLSTYLMAKFLDFPAKQYVGTGLEKRIYRWMTFFTIVTVAPSVYFLVTVLQDINTKKTIENLVINDLSENKKEEILKWEIDLTDSLKIIDIYVSGKDVPDSVVQNYNNALAEEGLKAYKVSITRVNLTREEIQEFGSELRREFLSAVDKQTIFYKREMERIKQESDSISKEMLPNPNTIDKKIKALYPNLTALGIGELVFPSDSLIDTITTVSVQWQPFTTTSRRELAKRKAQQQEDQKRLVEYLKMELEKDSILILEKD